MKLSIALAAGLLCVYLPAAVAIRSAIAADDEQALLQVDHAAFGSGTPSLPLDDKLLDPKFSWTDSSGNTRSRSQIITDFKSGKSARQGNDQGNGNGRINPESIRARIDGQLGIIQAHSGNLFALRIWVKQSANWRLLLYQAVSIGAAPSADAGTGDCDNPCMTVPFHPQDKDQRDVIAAYQAVERAVAAHDSAAWGAHIAEEFFAVTSNSDRPVDKVARMAGLDNQRAGGIAPFPLVSASMFQFGEAMVMTSRQQPKHGLPLHVTRVWFKRNGNWLEAYSYQTTIQAARSNR